MTAGPDDGALRTDLTAYESVTGPGGWTPLRARLAVGLTAVVLLVIAGMVVPGGEPAPPAASASQTRLDPPTQAPPAGIDGDRADAVAAVLDRRARAIVARDRGAFAATVNPRDASFRARQVEWFDNLADVPLADWSLQLSDGRVGAPKGLAERYGPGAFLARVTAGFRIAGFDHRSQRYEQVLTFVPRGGRWFVADVTDPRERTDRQLWDLGRVRTVTAEHGLVMGLGPRATLRRYAAELDRAVPQVGQAWTQPWPKRVLLVVPRTDREMAVLLGGHARDYRQIAAITRGELGAMLDDAAADRVYLNPSAYAGLSATGREVTMTHEVAHVALRASTQSWTPKWLSEGVADYIAYRSSGLADEVVAQELATEVRAGVISATLPPDRAFDAARDDLPQAYEEAWLACRLIVERYGGWDALAMFYRHVGVGSGAPTAEGGATAATAVSASDRAATEDVVPAVFESVLATSVTDFTAEWRAYLRTVLG